jgi:hypothetical protein
VVLGGTVFTKFADQLRDLPEFFRTFAQAVVVYEGETALAELVSQLEGGRDFSKVPNLRFLEHGRVRSTGLMIEDLDALPTPDFGGLPLDRYLAPRPVLPIAAGKGCYHSQCKFCGIPHINRVSRRRVRRRSPERLASDLRRLELQTGVRHFVFTDEALSPGALCSLADALGGDCGRYSFVGYARLDEAFSPRTCARIAELGVRKLFFGLESGSQRILDHMAKGTRVAAATTILTACRGAGIRFHLFSIIGFPEEDESSARETFRFFQENRDLLDHPGNSFDIHPFGLDLRTRYFEERAELGIEVSPRAMSREMNIGLQDGEWTSKRGLTRQRTAALLGEFGRRKRRDRRAQWRLNPTLGAEPDGAYGFWHFDAGVANRRRVQADQKLAEILDRLSQREAWDFEELVVHIEPLSGTRDAAAAAVESCIEGGVLVGGLQPPGEFQDAWEALERAEAALAGSEKACFRSARIHFRELASDLEAKEPFPSAAEIAEAQAASVRIVEGLARRLDLPCPKLGRAGLRFDFEAPYSIQIGARLFERIAQHAESFLRFQADFGFGAALRRAVAGHCLEGGGSMGSLPPPLAARPSPLTWQSLHRLLGADADFAQRIARWEHLLGGEEAAVCAPAQGGRPLPAPPFGWLLLGFAAREDGGEQAVIHGVFDDLWGPFARHAELFRDRARARSLQEWLSRTLSRVERECDLRFAELVAPFDQNPNVLARPALGLAKIAPWAAEEGSLALLGALLERDPRTKTPFLRIPGLECPVVVLGTSSSNVQSGDPVSQALLSSSLQAAPAGGFQASAVLFAGELASGCSSPEVALPGGEVVRTRRTALPQAELRALLRDPAPQRFRRWSRWARSGQWPALLAVRRDGGTPLVIHRDSPLALEAVLEGADGATTLVVEEWKQQAWIADGGSRYVAELAIPFSRSLHAWSPRSAAALASAPSLSLDRRVLP